ncbi:hypothetical protein HPP92_002314 [Vanilla planifolia]|uniref:BHLH domain-containing protein n=1 Tax=Vanilla planifolia TaxID=51239 RepID=A0A835SDJ8_VANPL|nr:hypothetical protein HPP92_002314 [Vanilla planifolia]
MASYSPDLSSFMPENEALELLWDNGQIVMQGQGNKTKKSSVSPVFPDNGRLEEKNYGQDGITVVRDLLPTVPCAHSDSLAPWMSYPIDESLQTDFCSDFFSEFAGAPLSCLSNTNGSLLPPDTQSSRFQKHGDAPKPRTTVVAASSYRNSSTGEERIERERAPEVLVASSSACSGYSVGVTLDEQNPKTKCRIRRRDECGDNSDDVGDESIAMKKPNAGRIPGAKRTRTAEIHNMSERRRRDRINEKMKALQELIPNCNKVDKASMLDEAIEYLKTLQLQVQMMSMGTGLCLPPMMMNAQHMGMGMGGLGLGMGMIDLNCPPGLFPVSSMGPTHFPCPSSTIHSMGIPLSHQGNPFPRSGMQPQSIKAVAPPLEEDSLKTMQACRNTAVKPIGKATGTGEKS